MAFAQPDGVNLSIPPSRAAQRMLPASQDAGGGLIGIGVSPSTATLPKVTAIVADLDIDAIEPSAPIPA